MSDQLNHPKALAKAYHPATRRFINKLPSHDVIRRMQTGSMHQLANVVIGEGMQVLDNEITLFEQIRSMNTTPTDELDRTYIANIPVGWATRPDSPNVLENTAFDWVGFVDDTPMDWTIGTPSGYAAGTVTMHDEYPYAGRSCLKVRLLTGSGVRISQTVDPIEISYADSLSYSFWTKLETGDPTASLQLRAQNILNGEYSLFGGSVEVPSSMEWERMVRNEQVARFPMTAVEYRADIVNDGTDEVILYFDAAQLELSATPSEWRPKADENAPWNITNLAGDFDISAVIGKKLQPVYYCAGLYDFFSRAVPTRAEISTADQIYDFGSVVVEFEPHIDYFGDEWRTRFLVQAMDAPKFEEVNIETITGQPANFPDGSPKTAKRIARDGFGNIITETRIQIVKENLDVPGEYLAQYDLVSLSSANVWEVYSTTMLQATMLRDLLVVLALEGGEYVLLIVNPQYEIPERNHLFLLNRLGIDGLADLFPTNFTVTLGIDVYDPDGLTIQILDTDTSAISNYRIKLWYDYYTLDNNANVIVMREDYSDYGGVRIR